MQRHPVQCALPFDCAQDRLIAPYALFVGEVARCDAEASNIAPSASAAGIAMADEVLNVMA